jgi:glycosyltransferase involved in cell wall biosynthesis
MLRKEKCFVVNGSGVNMQKFQLAPFPPVITFFMLSRMIYSKGIMQFLQAAAIIKKQYPEIRFTVLGNIEKKPDAIKKEELDSYIQCGIIEHYQESEEVSRYYINSSVFVLPTYYREGTPRVILEAMASGRPIITTNTPGCRETVIEGVNGFLIPIKDENSLVEKMEWFIKNPEEIQKMGKCSYDLCKAKYEVDIINKQMLSILEINENK